MESPSATVVRRLTDGRQTLGCAESLTGGGLAESITAVPGASAVLVGGVVSYATRVKRDLLGVTAERVISMECAEQMAGGVRRLLGVDWALATTGVAGPDLQEGQPAGTVYVGLAGPSGVESRRLELGGDRDAVRSAACAAAVRMLLDGLDRGGV